MLATSEEILSAWLSPARQLAVRVKVDQSSYGSEDVTSFSFDSGSISGEVYQIGSTYMNTVQIVFPSIIETIKEDQEVIPELGILVDGEYHYSKLGHFFITEFNRDRNAKTTTITASDKMIYMEGVYESKLTYSKPYREVALEIANLAGVEINQASFASLGTLAIKKPVGYTHRQAIGLIAQFEGGFASFNRDGELEVRRLRPTDFEVTPESYLLKGFTKNENAYRIGGITVRIGEEETDVLRVGSTNGSQIELENKVMTRELLNKIWDLVKNLNYFPFELKWRGSPVLEAGDWMYVTDRDGNRYSVPNLSYSLTFNGGLSGESKATTNSSSQATYKYRGSLKQKVDWLDSILSANNWNSNYYDATEPSAPKEGDAWFKPNGQDIEIWVYEKDAEGNLDWVFKISTATDPALIALIEENKRLVEEAQAAAEDAQKAGDDAQKAADEAKGLADQAGVDAGQALDKANDAVSKANDATQKVGGLETAVGLVTEQSANAVDMANQAKGNADTALGKADSAIGTAQDALNQSALAKSQAEEAIEKYLGMGMVPAWSWSADGTDRFTTVYPRENVFINGRAIGLVSNNSTNYPITNTEMEEDGEKFNRVQRTKVDSYPGMFSNFVNIPKERFNKDLSGKTVEVSCMVRASSPVSINWAASLANPQKTLPLNGKPAGEVTTKWKQLSTVISSLPEFDRWFRVAPSVVVGIAPDITTFYMDYKNWKVSIIEDGKLEATTYTPPPSEDYANAVPSYIGFAIEPSDNPADYTWIRNPEKVEGEVKVELTDINGELKRKVSQETFDQLNSTVINHSTLISQNQNAIKLKADQSTVDTINQTVADHSTAIDLNAEAIALKANQSTVDSLTGRVTEAEGSITTIAGQVALKANQSTVDTLNNTVNSLNSQLTVQAGKITGLTSVTDGHTTKIGALELQAGQFSLSLSDVRNDLDGMEIGGRNWMPASEAEWVTDKMYSNSAYGIYRTGLNGVYEHLVDNKVMVSFEVFIENTVDENATVRVYGLNGTPKYELLALNLTGVKTNQWVRVSGNIKIQKHATNTSESRIEFYGDGNTNTSKIRIRKLKLEKGTKATDWSPAPEDMATVTALTEVKATVDSLTMTVADKVDKTTVTQLANQWQQTTDLANGHTSQISSLGDAINLRVEKDDIINQINVNDQGILIAGEKVHITGLTKIENAVIKTANIVDLNVTEAKLGNLSVSTAKIADAAITSAKIGTAAIGTAHIGDGVITNAKIGNLAVSGAKIQDATISNAKIINLDAGKLSAGTVDTTKITIYGGSSTNYVQIAANQVEQTGVFTRIWQGVTTRHDTSMFLQNGYFRARNNTLDRSLYFSDFGISTFSDGDGGGVSSGTINFFDQRFGDSNGITINSKLGVVGLESEGNRVVIQGKDSANIQSTESLVVLRPYLNARQGYNTFIFGVQGTKTTTADETHGLLRYGSEEAGYASGLRFYKVNSNPRVAVVDYNNTTGGNTVMEAGVGQFNSVDARDGNQYIQLNGSRSSMMNFFVGKTADGSRRMGSDYLYSSSGSGKALHITSGGTIVAYSSSERFKELILPADDVNYKALLDLDLKSWMYKSSHSLALEGEPIRRVYGLIAEDVERAGLTQYTEYNQAGQVEGYKPELWTLTIPILNEHEKEILALKEKVQQLENEIRVLQAA